MDMGKLFYLPVPLLFQLQNGKMTHKFVKWLNIKKK